MSQEGYQDRDYNVQKKKYNVAIYNLLEKYVCLKDQKHNFPLNTKETRNLQEQKNTNHPYKMAEKAVSLAHNKVSQNSKIGPVYRTDNELNPQEDLEIPKSREITRKWKDVKNKRINEKRNTIENTSTNNNKSFVNRQVSERDPITFDLFKKIMDASKPKGAHEKTWGRFKITSAILFYSGLRLNQAALLTKEDIKIIVEEKKIFIYQKNIDQYREIVFIDQAIPFIKKAFEEYKEEVFKDHKNLFPAPPSGKYNGDKFIKLMNKYLATFSEQSNLVLKSHSFRVNFVTSLLDKSTVQDAQFITGHKDIRSTMAYNRYALSKEEKDNILKDAFS